MNDHEKRTPALQVGQAVLTPTGRTAIVQSVDERRGEASVVGAPWAASFRLSNLRPASPHDRDLLFLGIGEAPSENGEDPGGGG